MDENSFWKFIEKSKRKAVVPEAQSEILTDFLAQLDIEEIRDFDRILEAKLLEAYRWDLWAIAYIIHNGCSDDMFEYFRAWLISQGRDVFEESLSRPDSVGEIVEPRDWAENEFFLYVAQNAFEKKTASDRLLPSSRAPLPPKPSGEDWKEEDLMARFPALRQRFGFSLETSPGADYQRWLEDRDSIET